MNEEEYEPVNFTSLIDKPRGGKMRIDGRFAGSPLEAFEGSVTFSITPREGDTAPLVDGIPKVLVTLNRSLVETEHSLLTSASVCRVELIIDGKYIPKLRGDYIGDVFLDRN